ncbi:MAG: hypothetical protein RLZZ546_2529, partial [Bacteroidota bacterium]
MKYKLKLLNIQVIFITTFILSASTKTFSQKLFQYSGEPSIQSPNVTSLGKFGDIPVSLFTGTANINIPLTEIKNGLISVPIALQYDAGGCRPDQHPGWVGLNWNLQVGGVIRRTTNGDFDEFVHKERGAGVSYYNLYNTLASADWKNNLVDPNNPFSRLNDRSPDEFSFTFNNISGKFILNHEGKWIVQSKENLNLEIVHEMQSNYSVNFGSGNVIMPRSYTKFILTTGDGTKYIFGGQPNAIEFSMPAVNGSMAPHNELLPSQSYLDLIDGWETFVQASAWHLSEIISPSGNQVLFNYTTDFSFQQATYSEISQNWVPSTTGLLYHYTKDINLNNKYLIKSSYLDKIETNSGLVCTFSKSVSNELNWEYKQKPWTQDVLLAKPDYLCRYYKLDKIEIKTNDKTTKKITLGFIEKNTERLKLKEVKFLSLTDTQTESIYRMEYNNTLLPKYNSGLEDHWGYYNGTNYWGGVSDQYSAALPNMEDYYQSREANPALMQAEVIKRLIYPAGGYSEFTFEPHTYSKLVKQDPTITLQSLNANKIAGGLRIKKIETFDAFSTTPRVQEYFYNKNYINGEGLSS